MTLAEKGIGFLGVRLKKFLIHYFYIIIHRLSVAEFSTFFTWTDEKTTHACELHFLMYALNADKAVSTIRMRDKKLLFIYGFWFD